MKRTPMDPKLPGRYGRMTEAELDADVARYDADPGLAEREAIAADAAGVRPARPHPKRRRGRPSLPEGERVERVTISVPPALLARVDALAGGNRSAYFIDAARAAIERAGR